MKQLSILMLAAMLFSACQKENSSPKTPGSANGSNGPPQQPGTSLSSSPTPTQLDGTYTGNFSLSTTVTGQVAKVPVQLVLAGNQFNSGDLNLYYSVGGGTVATIDSVLNFTNNDAFPGYIKGSSIPLATVGLSGDYVYKIKGDSLLLSKILSDNIYTYKLKKQ